MKISKFFNWKVILAVIVILFIIFFSSIINFAVDFQWFKEVGYIGVYFTKIVTETKIVVPLFIILSFLIYVYLTYLKNEYIKYSKTIYASSQLKSINRRLLLTSCIISIVVSTALASSLWYDILKFMNATSFNLKDPLFNKDISFYIFKLPVYNQLYGFVMSALVVAAVITLVFYIFVCGSIKDFTEDGGNVLSMDRGRRKILGREIFEITAKHMAFFVSAIFVVLAVGFVLKSYDLVYSSRGVAFGASYSDVHVTLLFNRIFMVLSILAAISFFYALFRKNLKMTLWIIGLMVGASLIQGIVEAGVQRLIVTPNEIDKEKPFIEYNIKYTRLAYGLDKVEEKDFPAEQSLTPQDIENNRATINNIRVNDFAPTLQVYNQLQGMRPYYRFTDVDIDRYNIDGKYMQTFISARELDQDKIDPKSQTWQNKHLMFTHGFGITMSPVNTVTTEGQPKLIIKDIPPVSTVDLKIDRPEVYFGEITDDYIITNTKLHEMNYPSGDTNKQTVYNGNAGIKLNPLNRLIFAINRANINILLSQDITYDSRIILNRNIVDRVKTIAPFLSYDQDPYIVLNNGKLYWIIDAYTTSSKYPYSEPQGDINYVRNSVKVIIDAYNGTTNFYLIDENDPLAVTYSKIFPGLFKSVKDVPKGFVEHFRYPEDIFNIQLEVYKKYHMTNPNVFYNKEDLWSVSEDGQATESSEQSRMEPSYIVMKLPDEGAGEEFMLISPYTPNGKSNMVAWLAARMDGKNYGKLIVYKFPKQKVTYGPSQFMGRINQDTTISRELSLWRQQGSDAVIGSVLTIPIEKSLLYVAPVYIKSVGTNNIPEVKRVIVGYGDRIIMDETLEKALNSMFNLNAPEGNAPAAPNTQTVPEQQVNTTAKELAGKANELFKKAKDAQQSGNWADYGEYLKQLEDVLNQLNKAVE
jgi:uncharacterized membrane protein (UPF0182 family)